MATTETAAALLQILVVDDNVDAADSLGVLLQLLGAEVTVVHGGQAALDRLADFQPDVMFVDIGMPDVDGYEVARQVRSDTRFRPTLIALTGWGHAEDRLLSQQAGFDRHLVKPIGYDELQVVLDSLRGSK